MNLIFLIGIFAFSYYLKSKEYSLNFSKENIKFEKNKKFTRIKYKDLICISNPGEPELPSKRLIFVIPPDKKVKKIKITNKKIIPVKNNILVFPTQKPIITSIFYPPPPFENPDPEIYSKDTLFPGEFIILKKHGNLNGIKLVEIIINPFHYNPAKKRLYMVSEIAFYFEFEQDKFPAFQFLRPKESEKFTKNFLIKNVFNKEEVEKFYVYNYQLLDNKDYFRNPNLFKLAIITTPEIASAFEPLKNWYNERGLKTKIITIDEIYSKFDGVWDLTDLGLSYEFIGDEASKIKEFLLHNWLYNGLTYAILAGDEEIGFPVRYCWAWDDSQWEYHIIPNYAYFQDFTGNWDVDQDLRPGEPGDDEPDFFPEIFVGKIICDSSRYAKNWVEKIINYEKKPLNVEFFEHICWIYEDDSFNRWEKYVKIDKNTLDSFELDFKYHIIENHLSDANHRGLIDTISKGYGIIIFNTHGWIDRFRTTNPDLGFNIIISGPDQYNYPSIKELYNANRYMVIYSISCDPAAFDWEEKAGRVSMAEALISKYRTKSLIHDNPIGPVALLANTRFGFLVSSNQLKRIFLKNIFLPDFEHRLGPSDVFSKITYGGYIYLNYTLNLFGSPEMQIYTKKPKKLEIVCPRALPSGIPINLLVETKIKNEESILDSVNVHIYNRETNFYTNQYSDNTGEVVFENLILPKEDTLIITATKHNFIPQQKRIRIINLKGNIWNIYFHKNTLKKNKNITFDSTNKIIYMVYEKKEETIFFTYSTDYGYSWENPIFVAKGERPCLMTDNYGKLHLIYTKGNEIIHKSFNPEKGEWSEKNKLFYPRKYIKDLDAFLLNNKIYISAILKEKNSKISVYEIKYYYNENNVVHKKIEEIPYILEEKITTMIRANNLDRVFISLSISYPEEIHENKIYLYEIQENIWKKEILTGSTPYIKVSNDSLKLFYSQKGEIYYIKKKICEENWNKPFNISNSPLISKEPFYFKNTLLWTEYSDNYSDIYISEYIPDKGWTEPQNLSNTSLLFSVTPEGEKVILDSKGNIIYVLFKEGDSKTFWFRMVKLEKGEISNTEEYTMKTANKEKNIRILNTFIDKGMEISSGYSDIIDLKIFDFAGRKLIDVKNLKIKKGRNFINIKKDIKKGGYVVILKNKGKYKGKKILILK